MHTAFRAPRLQSQKLSDLLRIVGDLDCGFVCICLSKRRVHYAVVLSCALALVSSWLLKLFLFLNVLLLLELLVLLAVFVRLDVFFAS
jgi:hypothetical protein